MQEQMPKVMLRHIEKIANHTTRKHEDINDERLNGARLSKIYQ